MIPKKILVLVLEMSQYRQGHLIPSSPSMYSPIYTKQLEPILIELIERTYGDYGC